MEGVFDPRKYRKSFIASKKTTKKPCHPENYNGSGINVNNGTSSIAKLSQRQQHENVGTAGTTPPLHVTVDSPRSIDVQKPSQTPLVTTTLHKSNSSGLGAARGALDTTKTFSQVAKDVAKTTPMISEKTMATRSVRTLVEETPRVRNGPKTVNALAIQETLRRAQAEQIKAIRLRTRCHGKDYTTSPRDLHLARSSTLTPMRDSEVNVNWSPCGDMSKSRNSEILVQEYGKPTTAKCSLRHSTSTMGATRIPEQRASWELSTPDTQQESLQYSSMQTDKRTSISIESPKPDKGNNAEMIRVDADEASMGGDAESLFAANASQWSEDSLNMSQEGKTGHDEVQGPENTALLGFDGNIQPPPIDWNERPRFATTSPAFLDSFRRWREDAIRLTRHETTRGPTLKPFPTEQVKDLCLHPDGLGFVSRFATIDKDNAGLYGYEDITDATKYSQPAAPDLFEDWGKIDPCYPENKRHKNDCTKDYIRNWNINMEKHRRIQQARAEAKMRAKEAKQIIAPDTNIKEPDINIYIRPAVRPDIPQMASIYNYYIQQSCRTVELEPIAESDMRLRMTHSNSHQLPFLVAVLRNQKSMIPFDTNAEHQAWQNNGHPIKNIDPRKKLLGGIEKVVGWTSAQDFTAQHFVERLSVELELYVHPQFRRKGVARSLLDCIWRVLDRGYTGPACCPFAYAPELRHLYEPGGGRDIHKAVMIIRKYKHLRNSDKAKTPSNGDIDQMVTNADLNDHEDDFDQWMKPWLEKCGFQVEGLLSGMGAKKGRYIDLVYMGRETMWQPADGLIPDPIPDLS